MKTNFNNFILSGKRGQLGRQLMIFPFVFLLVIVGLSIVGAFYFFLSQGYDNREIGAANLAYKAEKCIAENIRSDSELKEKDNFYEKCKINKEVFEEYYGINITKDGNTLFHYGDLTPCYLRIGKSENYPICFKTRFHNYEIIVSNNQKIEVKK